MGIRIESRGDFNETERFLQKMRHMNIMKILASYGDEGVVALANATPRDTGLTAESWSYRIEQHNGVYEIIWFNTNVVDGRPVAILIQYGHGTGTGGYVTGQDYINPAIQPIFDRIATDVWRVVTSA